MRYALVVQKPQLVTSLLIGRSWFALERSALFLYLPIGVTQRWSEPVVVLKVMHTMHMSGKWKWPKTDKI